jgi:2-(1,2-epoxy-1,2-dihydrophenyl)acetyl-CoA isomerase
MAMTQDAVLTHSEAGVTTITMNRPERLNALSAEMMEALQAALQGAADDPACRCVLLTGNGRGFSSGADLSAVAPAFEKDSPIDFGAPLEPVYHPTLRLMRGMAKPVVAAVNGVAAGAGCNIALAADIVLAARSARFMQAFVRIGLVPDASGSWVVPRLIGRARAMQWMMSGEPLDAQTALDWGLIAELHDDEALPEQAAERARQLAAQPTQALAGIKRLLDASSGNDFEAQLALEARTQTEVGYSADTREGIQAFLEKRPAQFRGE